MNHKTQYIAMTTHHFGGSWTDLKLERLRLYLIAYSTALKKQSFKKLYIDAFAGTGYRDADDADEDLDQLHFELPGLVEVIKGSAPTAIEIEPSFDRFIFIEKIRKHFEALQKLDAEYPGKRSQMTFLNEDANNALVRICSETDWVQTRGVLFLDPYGNQVEWKTLEAVAATKAIDTWILFPVGMGVDRLLPKNGDVPQAWQNTLDRLLGEKNWREAFYAPQSENPHLFGKSAAGVQKLATPRIIERYFVQRLKTIFAGVAEHGLPLYNKKNYLMYLLCFACGNRRGAPIALRIAKNLLKP